MKHYTALYQRVHPRGREIESCKKDVLVHTKKDLIK